MSGWLWENLRGDVVILADAVAGVTRLNSVGTVTVWGELSEG